MSTVNRKLTSILATDCVGFSGHMEKDEEKTLDNLIWLGSLDNI